MQTIGLKLPIIEVQTAEVIAYCTLQLPEPLTLLFLLLTPRLCDTRYERPQGTTDDGRASMRSCAEGTRSQSVEVKRLNRAFRPALWNSLLCDHSCPAAGEAHGDWTATSALSGRLAGSIGPIGDAEPGIVFHARESEAQMLRSSGYRYLPCKCVCRPSLSRSRVLVCVVGPSHHAGIARCSNPTDCPT